MEVYYPTDEDLARIRTWKIANREDILDLLEVVRSLWHYADFHGFEMNEERTNLKLNTYGWSGNESVVEALQENFSFWACCWRLHQRGGHYEFSIPEELG
jgi:hypothetical protein